MLEPLDERAGGQRGAGRRGARRRWGVIVALVAFIVAMVAVSKWAEKSGDGKGGSGSGAGSSGTTTTTTTGLTGRGAGR